MTEQTQQIDQGTQQTAQPAAWYSEDQKAYVEAKGWKAPTDAISSYINHEKLFSADRAGRTIVMPKDEADVEGRKAFLAKLGVPESPDKYQFDLPNAKGPEEIAFVASMFHEADVPLTAANKIMTKLAEYTKQTEEAEALQAQAESTKQLEAVKAEWGDKFDQNSEFAKRFLRASGWDDDKISKYEQAFGTAQMLKDFHSWGSKIGEQSFEKGNNTGGFADRSALQAQMNELRMKRVNNQIGQDQYLAEADRLGKLIDAA